LLKKIILFYFLCLLPFGKIFSQYDNNYSATFNGFNSYVAVPNSLGLSPTGGITLEAWVNPSQLGPGTMSVIGKNYQTSYFIGLQVSGRVVFYPKGGASLRSKVTGVIPVNQWTHIAGTYNGTSTAIYINGVLDTITYVNTGPVTTNSDSLFIGADRVGAATSLFFRGKLDNVRIWGDAKGLSQINHNMFTPLEITFPTGEYINLRASFQLNSNGLNYGGSELNIGHTRNISFADISSESVNYLDYNNSLVLNGTTDYFTVSNHAGFNATNAVTLEAWIRRDTTGTQPNDQYIVNKSGGTNRFGYALWLNSSTGILKFKINSVAGPSGIVSLGAIQTAQWTHVAATYNSATGIARLYINGKYSNGVFFSGSPLIQNDPDNLFIGGIGATDLAAYKFKGQIDGVRIWKTERSLNQINDNMYNNLSDINMVSFDFDEKSSAVHNGNTTSYNSTVFAGSAHISSSHLNNNNELTSPVLSNELGNFNSSQYTVSTKRTYIPDGYVSGIWDSVYIPANGSITDIKLFTLISHKYTSDLDITLTSPSGNAIMLIGSKGSYGNDIMTLFSDGAGNYGSGGVGVNDPGITPPFSPSIRPAGAFSIFDGENMQGWWKLNCSDKSSGNIGYVHGWGLNISSVPLHKVLILNALIQGFYDMNSNEMVQDYVKVNLRQVNSPYSIIDSSVTIFNQNGVGKFNFSNITNATEFYIQTDHRNSVNTWTSGSNIFNSDTLYYNFTLAAGQAFGANQIKVDNSPVRYAIYNGDVNKDEIIDLTDISLVDNDAANFMTGYVLTDLTGDQFIDLNDLTIADNNAFNFISVIKP